MNANLQPGSHIGDYILDAYLGAGGFGAVWRGHKDGDDEPVAVKFLTGAASNTATAAMRADIELLAAAASGRSRHVVKVLGGGDTPVPYIVMEYVEGSDLAAQLKDNARFSAARTVEVGLAIADALVALNEAGIVHRDIKPANVIVDSAGVIKLADFGIAKIVGYETVTMTGNVAMTMAYAAPEVWEDDDANQGRPTHKSDLYAMGILLYECLAGATPFRGSYGAMYRAHRERPVDLSSLPADVPASLREVIRRCLLKDPTQRPSDARECLRYLRRADVEVREAAGEAPSDEPSRFGHWLRESPHPLQPWAWLCRQEGSGAQATVELHFTDDLEYGAVLRKAVVANPRLAPLGAERLLDTNRLILRPGETWTGGLESQFQFWLAREEEPALPQPQSVSLALARQAAGALTSLIEAAQREEITLAFPPEDVLLQADGRVRLLRPGIAISDDAAKSALAYLRSLPLDPPARDAVDAAKDLRAVAPRAQSFGTASIGGDREAKVVEEEDPADAMQICASCRASVAIGEPFCSRCGAPMGRRAEPQCPRCRALITPDDAFCGSCGQPLGRKVQSACPRCQAPYASGEVFCGNCGQRLAEEPPAARGYAQHNPVPYNPLPPLEPEKKRRWPFGRD